jgi:hypothetical protein
MPKVQLSFNLEIEKNSTVSAVQSDMKNHLKYMNVISGTVMKLKNS